MRAALYAGMTTTTLASSFIVVMRQIRQAQPGQSLLARAGLHAPIVSDGQKAAARLGRADQAVAAERGQIGIHAECGHGLGQCPGGRAGVPHLHFDAVQPGQQRQRLERALQLVRPAGQPATVSDVAVNSGP